MIDHVGHQPVLFQPHFISDDPVLRRGASGPQTGQGGGCCAGRSACKGENIPLPGEAVPDGCLIGKIPSFQEAIDEIQSQPIDITIKKIKPNTWPLLGILILVTVLVTLILYPKIVIIQSPYKIGDIADKNFKATLDFTIEDTETLSKKRAQARDEVLTVYNYESSAVRRQ